MYVLSASNSHAHLIHLQERFQEDPVHMAMIICRNLKEEQKILATAKSVEVKPQNYNKKSYFYIITYLIIFLKFFITSILVLCQNYTYIYIMNHKNFL